MSCTSLQITRHHLFVLFKSVCTMYGNFCLFVSVSTAVIANSSWLTLEHESVLLRISDSIRTPQNIKVSVGVVFEILARKTKCLSLNLTCLLILLFRNWSWIRNSHQVSLTAWSCLTHTHSLTHSLSLSLSFLGLLGYILHPHWPDISKSLCWILKEHRLWVVPCFSSDA